MLPEPYYDRDGITIYHADCRDILPHLAPGSVDLVLTDPPYGVGFDYGTGYDDKESGYRDFLWPVLEESERTISPGGYVVCFQAAKYARQWAEWFPRDWRLLALPKKFVQMLPVNIQWSTDYALFWQPVPLRNPEYPGIRDWFVSSETLMGRTPLLAGHPCPRPIDTMTYLVNGFSFQGQTILDPFMGSGTTLRAAKDLGRRAIGIELEERYCEIAAKRLSQAVLPLHFGQAAD
jgi:site-specific DNA-methyltransferase (adenine-specific)